MNESTIKSSLRKRQFYAQPQVASAYETLRFGGASGAWVNAREINLVLAFLPAAGRVLDLGCGTGRLANALAPRQSVFGVDTSNAMLAQARERTGPVFAQADAFTLPFADAAFDAVTALRFAFHFESLDTFLRQARRVVKPGGVVVFDTYLWSPRAWLPIDRARWGMGVYVHPPRRVEASAQQIGFRVQARQTCFLFSPYLYRRLPLALVRGLERIEAHLPPRFHARVFWKLERAD